MEFVEPSLAVHTYEPSEADAWNGYKNPESFSYEQMGEEEAAVFLGRYHEAISQTDRFVGSGNHAMVFDLLGSPAERPRSCAKLSWEGGSLAVEVRGKNFRELPDEYQHLRGIQNYFDKVKAEYRARLAANPNAVFKPQLDIEREALAQNYARNILEKGGFPGGAPLANGVVSLEREHDGQTDAGNPFMVSEKAKAILMERIEGATIQDIILRRVDWWDEVAEGDVEQVASKIEAMVAVLGRGGLAHNDLSNRNVMIERGTLNPVIIDFGKASADTTSGDYEDIRHAREVSGWLRRFGKNPDDVSADLGKKLGEFVAI
jgi:hypothetical protein